MEEFNELKENKSKRIIKIVLLVIVLLTIITGISYAAWNYNFIGSLTNLISRDSVSLKFLESNNKIVSITNALPLTDEEGKLEENTYDFAVTSKTKNNTSIGYTLSIEKLETDQGYTFLEDNQVKIYLEDYEGNVLLEPIKISDLDNYMFYSSIHEHSANKETIQDKYRLRVWIDESMLEEAKNWNMNTKIQYSFKINVNSEETDPITVTFDANGGTTPVQTKKVVANSLYGNLPTPTREGYTFKGWNGKNLLNLHDREVRNPGGGYNKTSLRNELNGNGIYIGFTASNYYQPLNIASYSIDYDNNNVDLVSNSNGYGIGFDVKVKSNKMYAFRGANAVMQYASDGTRLSTQPSGRPFITDSNVDYIIIECDSTYSGRLSSFNHIQLEEGTVATPYEPYYLTPSTKVVQTSNHTLKAIWEEN